MPQEKYGNSITQITPDIEAGDARGWSRGYTSGGEVLGEAIKAAGSLFTEAVKIRDTDIQDHIKQDVEAASDYANNKIGVDAAANVEALKLADSPRPQVLQEALEQLQLKKEAFDQGNISDTSYHSYMHATIKSLRSRYPGYRDQIDKIAGEVMSHPTANAIRSGLVNSWQAEQKAKGEKWTTTVNEVQQMGPYWDPGDAETYFKAAEAGDRKAQVMLIAKYSSRMREDKIVEQRAARLNLISSTNSINDHDYKVWKEGAAQDWAGIGDRIIQDAMERAEVAEGPESFNNWFIKLGQGGYTPEEITAVDEKVSSLVLAMQQRVSGESAKSFNMKDPMTGKQVTYQQLLGDAAVKTQIDKINAWKTQIMDIVHNNDYGKAKALINQYKIKKDQVWASMGLENDTIVKLEAARERGLGDKMDEVLQKSPEKADHLTQTLMIGTTSDLATGLYSTKEKIQQLSQAVKAGAIDHGKAGNILVSSIKMGLDAKGIKDIDTFIDSAFRDFNYNDAFGEDTPAIAKQVFNSFTSPQALQNVSKASAESRGFYGAFLIQSFQQAYNAYGGQINDYLGKNKPVFNEETGKFETGAMTVSRGGKRDDLAYKMLTDLNEQMAILKKVYDLGGTGDWTKDSKAILNEIGIKDFKTKAEVAEEEKAKKEAAKKD